MEIPDNYERRIHMLTRSFLKHAFLAVAVCAMLCALTSTLRAAQQATTPDLKPYQTLAQEALKLVTAKDMKGASKKMAELEGKWDSSGLDQTLPNIDSEMDAAKDAVKSGDAKKATAELNTYLGLLARASKPAKK
jgi:outer membrane protein assembly factor BamD (BamD/ComL family)